MAGDSERLHLLTAIAQAMEHCHTVIDIIASAETDEDASVYLEDRLGWTALRVDVVMGMQFRRVNAVNKKRIHDEIAQLSASTDAAEQAQSGPDGFVGDTP